MSLLVTSEILGLFFNTMTADDKYSPRSRNSVPQPIQMHLSETQKFFTQLLPAFLNFTSIFKYFEKKMKLIAYVFPKLKTAKNAVLNV